MFRKLWLGALLLTFLGALSFFRWFLVDTRIPILIDDVVAPGASSQTVPSPASTEHKDKIQDVGFSHESSSVSVASGTVHQNPISTANPESPIQLIDNPDPFDITRNIFYGPWKAKIPRTVVAREEFTMEFSCTSPDEGMCPRYYMVLFHGPTRQSVPPDVFIPLNWTYNSPDEYATVQANWTIHDPGEYNVYAYPEFVYCEKWKEMEWSWEKAAVQGSPFELTVHRRAPRSGETKGFGTCKSEHIDDGRYLSTNASLSSTQFAALYEGSGRKFVWAPYKCKIPTRNINQVLDLMPTAKHFVFIGDSQTRGGFCSRIWERIHGTVSGSVCDYKNSPEEYWEMKWGHKFTSIILEKNEKRPEQRNVSFSYLWVAHNFSDVIPALLSLKNPPPTHVVFNMGLWLAWEDVDSLQEIYWDFLDFMKDNFPSVQHIILKTMTSVVQAVQCYGEYNIVYSEKADGVAPPEDSLDFRIGGAKKRHAIYEVARRWNRQFDESPPFKVSAIDAWQLTDNRPETTNDGRNWIDEGRDNFVRIRPGIGEAEDCIQDRIWDDFVNERVTW